MNNKRRGRLNDVLKTLFDVSDIIDTICDSEQDCLDNYPENLQNSDQYERTEEAIDSLTDAKERIDEAIDCIQSAIC